MLWVKAFHIVFVASWFAGLFYLPRLFVNLATVPADSHAERERLLMMARKLYRFSSLLMVPALVLGLALWWQHGFGLRPGQRRGCTPSWCSWCWRSATTMPAVRCCAASSNSTNRRSERWFRAFNESAVLIFAAIVVLAVVKPF